MDRGVLWFRHWKQGSYPKENFCRELREGRGFQFLNCSAVFCGLVLSADPGYNPHRLCAASPTFL
jgi:hypothetical protein